MFREKNTNLAAEFSVAKACVHLPWFRVSYATDSQCAWNDRPDTAPSRARRAKRGDKCSPNAPAHIHNAAL